MAQDGEQQVAEAPGDVEADCLDLEGSGKALVASLLAETAT